MISEDRTHDCVVTNLLVMSVPFMTSLNNFGDRECSSTNFLDRGAKYKAFPISMMITQRPVRRCC